jgi:hypothetical protein
MSKQAQIEFGGPGMVRMWLGLLFCLGFAPGFFAAEPAAPAPPPNRCLLIVETSGAMARRTEATLLAVQTLLSSNLQGHLRRGDTLGVWTFNKQLHAGEFPLQVWAPEANDALTSRVLDYLRTQSFGKTADLATVLPDLKTVIESSRNLTIVLVTSAEGDIQGTPFDTQINQSFQAWREEQRKAREPFITVLRAAGGKFVEYAVAAAPWPLSMPPLPPELLSPRTHLSTNTAPPVSSWRQPAQPPSRTTPKPPQTILTLPHSSTVQPPVHATNAVSASVAVPSVASNAAHALPQAEPSILVQPSASFRVGSNPPQTSLAPVAGAPAPGPSGSVTNAPEVSEAAASNRLVGNRGLWAFGFCAGGLLVGFGYFARRRARQVVQTSLITRSLDRK